MAATSRRDFIRSLKTFIGTPRTVSSTTSNMPPGPVSMARTGSTAGSDMAGIMPADGERSAAAAGLLVDSETLVSGVHQSDEVIAVVREDRRAPAVGRGDGRDALHERRDRSVVGLGQQQD